MKVQPEINTSIYLINLDRDGDRLALMTKQLSDLGLTFDRIRAIYGLDMQDWLHPYFLNAHGEVASDLRLGEVGCYASHLHVMLRVIQDKRPALVLEDDLEIEPDFPQVLEAISYLPTDWDIVRLSNHYRRGFIPLSGIGGRYRIVKFCRVPPSTGAYLISPKGANKFLAWKGLRSLPVDQDLRHVWDCGMITYGVHPRPVRPDIGESSIAKIDSRAIVAGRRRKRLSDAIRDIRHSVDWLGPTAWARSMLGL
jgi:glycosyl transferase family 25